ncbi:unnamed protein product [Lota lota]
MGIYDDRVDVGQAGSIHATEASANPNETCGAIQVKSGIAAPCKDFWVAVTKSPQEVSWAVSGVVSTGLVVVRPQKMLLLNSPGALLGPSPVAFPYYGGFQDVHGFLVLTGSCDQLLTFEWEDIELPKTFHVLIEIICEPSRAVYGPLQDHHWGEPNGFFGSNQEGMVCADKEKWMCLMKGLEWNPPKMVVALLQGSHRDGHYFQVDSSPLVGAVECRSVQRSDKEKARTWFGD